MALKECLLTTIVLIVSIEISSALTWNPAVHRYESYDLERGPVFYEAYYPDNNEESRNDYQEKRYFDRGAVLERTYQVPSDRFAYPDNRVQSTNYENRGERLDYPERYADPRAGRIERNLRVESVGNRVPEEYARKNDFVGFRGGNSMPEDTRDVRFLNQPDPRSFEIKEISSLARRAISRDLENWNALENYLDRTKYQDDPRSVYRRQFLLPEPTEIDPRSLNSFNEDPRNSNVVRRLTVRDLAGRNSLGPFDPIRYQNQQIRPRETVDPRDQRMGDRDVPLLNKEVPENPQKDPMVDPYPPENIFEPRPQVINYVFSKKPSKSENKIEDSKATKEAPKESMPRNYGDNLIQEEIEKTQDSKDVKVTSIEVSEVPRHKTRHHHGEWPKRDYSHRHQA